MRKFKASEAQRVARDIAAIRTALKNHGYQLRKRLIPNVPFSIMFDITPDDTDAIQNPKSKI